MPIIINNYNWEQTDKLISINLPLRGAKASNVDFLCTPDYLKVSYPPYYFECWCFENIDDDKCEITISNGLVTIKLEKLEPNVWPQLNHLNYEDKDLVKLTRENALSFSKDKAEKKAQEKRERIAENKKIALKEQMKIEEEDRNRIKNIKEDEKQKASDEIENFKQIHKKVIANELVTSKLAIENNATQNSKQIFDSPAEFMSQAHHQQTSIRTSNVSQEKLKTKITPDPRGTGRIEVKFTPRVFPTPVRESQEQNEKEWLQKQMESRKITDVPVELSEFSKEEMNVDWLKDKAGQFYKNGNYLAAISVYNHAIRLFPKVPAFFSNRAACHFNIRNLMKCVEDCSSALELLTPPVESNLQSRIKSHVRRGTAFCELELYAEGLMDYEAALKLDPNNSELRNDADNIRKIIQGN